MCETCISTKHEAVFIRDHATIEESISKHDEARINPNDISVDDIPIDSDTSLSLSVGLNELPISTETQSKDNENSGQIDAPNQNITDANPRNANTTHLADGKNQRHNTNDGNPKQNNTNPVTVNSFAQTDSIENTHDDKPNSDMDKTPICKFHLQGICTHGLKGKLCKFLHPNLCRKYIKSGQSGCNLGLDWQYYHPKLCNKSLNDNSCPRKRCYYYHVTGSSRPNYTGGPKVTPNNVTNKKQHMQLPKQTNPTSCSQNVKPLLPDQAAGNSHADSYSRHFLDELHQLKAQLHSMLGQQRQMMQSQISHQWSAAPRSDKPQWWQSLQFPHYLNQTTLTKNLF